MFPLSFSSSSSLSSIPPSLDSISELDRSLSDISEDDDNIVSNSTSHTPWTLHSIASSPLSDQQLANLECLIQNPSASCTIASSQMYSSEILGAEEGCLSETRVTAEVPDWWSWFSLRGVVKCVSFVLFFLSLLGMNGNRCVAVKLYAGLGKRLRLFTATLPKLTSNSAVHLKILTVRAAKCITSRMTSPKLCLILNDVALKSISLVAFFTSSLPAKCGRLARAGVLSCPLFLSTLFFLPSKVFSLPPSLSFLTLYPLSSSGLPATMRRYLLNPSPLFLPSLLVVFLLLVMLTASQSLVLALILATPLGLTLCCLENMVSSQHMVEFLPMFVPEKPSDQSEEHLKSHVIEQASPLTLKPTPRHQGHTHTNWTQEMCDPAA